MWRRSPKQPLPTASWERGSPIKGNKKTKHGHGKRRAVTSMGRTRENGRSTVPNGGIESRLLADKIEGEAASSKGLEVESESDSTSVSGIGASTELCEVYDRLRLRGSRGISSGDICHTVRGVWGDETCEEADIREVKHPPEQN